MPFKASNNRKAVVVCAIHVVKRPCKRSVLVLINRHSLIVAININIPFLKFQLFSLFPHYFFPTYIHLYSLPLLSV